MDVMEGAEYEFRVVAINTCGPGEPSGSSDFVIARDPQSKIKLFKLTIKQFFKFPVQTTDLNNRLCLTSQSILLMDRSIYLLDVF